MPEQRLVETVASGLRKGDLIVDCQIYRDLISHTVVSSKIVRTRYAVEVSGEEGNVVRNFRSEEPVRVLRSVPTEEELRQAEEDAEAWVLRSILDRMLDPDHITHLRAALADFENGGSGFIRYSGISDILDAQERYQLGLFLNAEVEKFMAAGASELQALRGAFAWVIVRCTEEKKRNPISRSTNLISNLMEDVSAFVLDDIRWAVRRRVRPVEEVFLQAAEDCYALLNFAASA